MRLTPTQSVEDFVPTRSVGTSSTTIASLSEFPKRMEFVFFDLPALKGETPPRGAGE